MECYSERVVVTSRVEVVVICVDCTMSAYLV